VWLSCIKVEVSKLVTQYPTAGTASFWWIRWCRPHAPQHHVEWCPRSAWGSNVLACLICSRQSQVRWFMNQTNKWDGAKSARLFLERLKKQARSTSFVILLDRSNTNKALFATWKQLLLISFNDDLEIRDRICYLMARSFQAQLVPFSTLNGIESSNLMVPWRVKITS